MSSSGNWNDGVIKEFRANGGKLGGYFAGRPTLLLHTTGAKTGQERVNPVACIKDGDDLVVVASKSGAPTNPDWYHNLVAHPLVTVEVGTDTLQARAEVTVEPERSRLYQAVVATHPGFAEYESKTTRKIPVIRLHPLPKAA